MARLAATLSVPRFGSCFAAFRAAAALVIFPWKLLADARPGTTPKRNVAAASPTTSVRRQRRLAELEVKQIESIVSPLPSSRGLSFSLRTSPVNPMATRWLTQYLEASGLPADGYRSPAGAEPTISPACRSGLGTPCSSWVG